MIDRHFFSGEPIEFYCQLKGRVFRSAREAWDAMEALSGMNLCSASDRVDIAVVSAPSSLAGFSMGQSPWISSMPLEIVRFTLTGCCVTVDRADFGGLPSLTVIDGCRWVTDAAAEWVEALDRPRREAMAREKPPLLDYQRLMLEWAEAAQSIRPQRSAPEAPLVCQGCLYWAGEHHLKCAVHPHGPTSDTNCLDWELSSDALLEV